MTRAALLLLAGCGELADPLDRIIVTDAGSDSHEAGSLDASNESCPLDGFLPPVLSPPSGKHQGKCSQAKLDTYHKCVLDHEMAACQSPDWFQWKECIACLECVATDPSWGPVVYVDSTTYQLNVEGCVNLATDQSGPASCGQRLHAMFTCARAPCSQVSVCKKYEDAYEASCSRVTIGAYPDLDNCFRRQTETDSKAVRVRMDTFFCGP